MELLVSCMRYVKKVLSVCFNAALEDWRSVERNPETNFMLVKSQMPVVFLWMNQIIMTIFHLLMQASKLYIQIAGKKLWTSWCIGLSWCWITCEWCWIIIILLKVFHSSDFYVWRLFLTIWPLLLEGCVAQSIGKIT